MHYKLENLPVIIEAPGTKMQVQHGLGNMAVAYNEFPPMPLTPNLLEGLPNDSCPCPHWGYMLKGSMHIRYDGGDGGSGPVQVRYFIFRQVMWAGPKKR